MYSDLVVFFESAYSNINKQYLENIAFLDNLELKPMSIQITLNHYLELENDANIFNDKTINDIIKASSEEDLLFNILVFCFLNVNVAKTKDYDINEVIKFANYLQQRMQDLMQVEKEDIQEPLFVVEFKNIYPEFKDINADRILELESRLKCIFSFLSDKSCKSKYLTFLTIAHYLSTQNQGVLGSSAGVVSSASVGGVSVSFSQVQNTTQWQSFFSATKYGLELLAIRSTLGSARLIN